MEGKRKKKLFLAFYVYVGEGIEKSGVEGGGVRGEGEPGIMCIVFYLCFGLLGELYHFCLKKKHPSS